MQKCAEYIEENIFLHVNFSNIFKDCKISVFGYTH